MANICNNVIRMSHNNSAMIDRFIANRNRVCSEFIPVPDILTGEDAYYWIRANWGIKHDIEIDTVERVNPNALIASFETAWVPPISAYTALQELGFEIEAYYVELGSSFCGMWINGVDEEIDIVEQTAEWAEANIPSDIADEFGLVEMFAEMESMNEE